MSFVIGCIDGATASTAVCEYSAWAATQLSAPVLLLHVLENSTLEASTDVTGNIGLGTREHLLEQLAELDEQRAKLALKHGHMLLEQAEQKVRKLGLTDIHQRQRHGGLAPTLLDMEQDVRLAVLGLHGEDSINQLRKVGSHLETVIRSVHRPLLLTPDEFQPPKSAMLAYDGSETAKKGVELVTESPLFKGMPVHLVMVDDDTVENQERLDWAAEHLRAGGHDVETKLLSGNVEESLHSYQTDHGIDIMVMGAFGHSRIRQFLVGSTTMRMLQESTTPVLVLR
ncbi:universal stress protein [Pseudidiomarina terrestris]|uniref:Universal stress protein n=1 Tax=Pseudidiomarina terrestris TaxID=2820060 RepID=A0AAW7R2H7_9GAMM|nr:MULTISPECIES: universal stress protein [unclassified Pseudidiomarina]MDN7125177.1 universal stress protein [Pseudidiomarina sp. 1APP75-32.1]MDN7127420.1 universal stress protein [Pseudidiomarina sp. 1APR75-33.1]MDN7129938.1 universal stress protein [Pseudidiomarina sp. 1APR75-15]MDN7136104.1 universal stress protein [Pseudidiomarina sp. 1ASP75-5]MEA3588957.1 universal stress protein [Pseudidiomarina sp. 1APP75-27a]